MKSYIVKDKEFRIIPKDVKGSTICVVEDAVDDYFSIQLKTHEDYSVNEPVELFSNTPQGLLYFKSCIKEVDKDLVKLLYPITHKFLQRREYTRVEFLKNILLKDEDKTIKATILDISAGGLKLSTPEEMSLSKNYKLNFELDKNVVIDCLFQPIRIESDNAHGYTVSGRFKVIKNIARISLVQFCFRKQLENQNK